MDLQFLFQHFVTCDIDFTKRQLFEVEEAEWKEELYSKLKLKLYRHIKSRKNIDTIWDASN